MLVGNVSKERMVANLRALADRVEQGTSFAKLTYEVGNDYIHALKIDDPIPKPDHAIYTIKETFNAGN